MVQHSFVIDTHTESALKDRALLLDTNALLDAYRLPSEFYDLTKKLVSLGCDYTTTRTIIIEFLGGTKDEDNLKQKKKFLEVLFGTDIEKIFYLPMNKQELDLNQLLDFSRHANKFSIADFELYQTIKKYGDKVALISRNHKDFSTSLMERISFITLLGKAEIHTYGVYAVVEELPDSEDNEVDLDDIPF